MVDQNQPQLLEYLITNLGTENIILGLPWLQKVNPDIDWKEGQLAIPPSNKVPHTITIEDVPEPKESNIGGTTRRYSKLIPNTCHFHLLPQQNCWNYYRKSTNTGKKAPLCTDLMGIGSKEDSYFEQEFWITHQRNSGVQQGICIPNNWLKLLTKRSHRSCSKR